MAEWVAHQTDEQEVSDSNPSIPPQLKYTCGEGDWLLYCHYTLANVLHQRFISGNIYCICLCKVRIRQNPLWLWNPEEMSSPKYGHPKSMNKLTKRMWWFSEWVLWWVWYSWILQVKKTCIILPSRIHEQLSAPDGDDHKDPQTVSGWSQDSSAFLHCTKSSPVSQQFLIRHSYSRSDLYYL